VTKKFVLLGLFLCGSAFADVDENLEREVVKFKAHGYESRDGVVDLEINFNKDWLFKLGDVADFFKRTYKATGWRKLDVPHDWSIEGQIEQKNPSGVRGGFYPMGIGCYRKTFVMDDSAKGKRVKIRFDGVYMNSDVYLNGVFLGNRPYGFSTFEYDLTPHLRFDGKENVIAVRVDNSRQPNCRWYTGSGINRNVHLYVMEQQHFQSFKTFFRTEAIDGDTATVKVDCEVISNNYPESTQVKFQLHPEEVTFVEKEAKVVVFLKDQAGQIVAETEKKTTLRDFSEQDFSLDLKVDHPQLWSDKTPYLYELELQLWVAGKQLDQEVHRVGIRTVEFNATQGMVVNGEKVIAKGVCLHKDAGSFGTAVPQDVWRFRLEMLKEMGCNAVRVHGPADPDFIEVCDELGFYMMSEAFDEWRRHWEYGLSESPSGKVQYGYHQYFNQWAETDLKDMVRRDRNHPSVVIYSVGNEVPEQRFDEGPETLQMLIDWVKEEDSTRPTTVGCDWSRWGNKSGFMDTMDVAGYNYPDRYYPNLYEEQHAEYPNRILLGTENTINEKNWLAVRDNPYVVGMFLWVGMDYIGESHKWPRRNWEWGLIDIGTFEKSHYYNWQAYWSDKPMVHAAIHLEEVKAYKWLPISLGSFWNFKDGEKRTVFVFSNTKEVELFLNGKSLGRKPVDPNSYKATYVLDYQKGELTAKAYDGNEVVAEHVLKTAEKAEKIGIKNRRENVPFKSDELLFFAVEVQDENGTRCPDAKNEITVSVEGAAELIGLDSGDAFSHELYKQNKRNVFEGQLMMTLRPTGSGEVTVRCKADGLKESELAFVITNPK